MNDNSKIYGYFNRKINLLKEVNFEILEDHKNAIETLGAIVCFFSAGQIILLFTIIYLLLK